MVKCRIRSRLGEAKGVNVVIVGWVVVLTLALSSCGRGKWEHARPASAPFRSFSYRGSALIAELEPSRSISDVARLAMFAGLTPGMDRVTAAARLGPPTGVRTDGRGTWYRFETTAAVVEVGLELAGSGYRPAQSIGWRLYAYPRDPSVEYWLGSQIAAVIESHCREIFIIVPRGSSSDQQLQCEIHNNRISSCSWYE